MLKSISNKTSSSSSSASSQSAGSSSKYWPWIKDLIDEAHLPKLGLPTKWNTSQEQHTKIAFDPNKN